MTRFPTTMRCKQILLITLLFWWVIPTITFAATIGKPNNYVSLNSGLVGWWTFDGADMSPNVRDRSGQGNHGNLIGQTATTTVGGRLGQALRFDGVDDYVVTNFSSNTNFTDNTFSVSVWFKSVADGVMVSKGAAAVGGWAVRIVGGKACVYMKNGSDDSYSRCSTVSVNNGAWQHIVALITTDTVTSNNNVANIYVNGSLNQGASSNLLVYTSPTQNVAMGVRWGGSPITFFPGSIDDVRVYNRALSASEIKQLYAMGATKLGLSTPAASSLSSGLVGHWTFDGKDMGPNVRDISGQGNHGDLSGQTATTSVGGRLGQALSFDGVDDYINIPANSSLNVTNYTLSFWLYKNNDLCAASGFRDYVSKDDGNTFYVGEQCASPRRYLGHSPSQEVSVSGKFPVGRWVHVSGTFDTTNNTINFYQDGVLIGSGDTFTTDPSSTDSLTRIGAWSSVVPESFIFGKMDDVRVYNRALSASEIKQLYAMGATKLGLSTPAASSLSSGLVGHWTFDGKDMGPNVRDISGQGNHGDLSGQTATTSVGGRLGQALSFDGVDDYVQTDYVISNYPMTLCAWINPQHNAGDNLLDVFGSLGAFLLIVDLGDDTGFQFYDNADGVLNHSANVIFGKWQHVCAVIGTNGSNSYMYVNGMGEGPEDFTNIDYPDFSFSMGGVVSPDFKGSLDDVRIYNRALSASEVQQLYNMGR